MNSMDVGKRRSTEELLSEFRREAELLREQICQIRRQQIDRILRLSDECRRVDRSLTMQTAELKSHVERIQRQIDQLHRCRQEAGQLGAGRADEIAEGEHVRREIERPLSKMLGKLLTCPDSENGRILRNFTPNAPTGAESAQRPHAGGSEEAKGAKRRSGPLDSEQIRGIADLAKRLASYQDLPVGQSCIRRHEQI